MFQKEKKMVQNYAQELYKFPLAASKLTNPVSVQSVEMIVHCIHTRATDLLD